MFTQLARIENVAHFAMGDGLAAPAAASKRRAAYPVPAALLAVVAAIATVGTALLLV